MQFDNEEKLRYKEKDTKGLGGGLNFRKKKFLRRWGGDRTEQEIYITGAAGKRRPQKLDYLFAGRFFYEGFVKTKKKIKRVEGGRMHFCGKGLPICLYR